MNYTVKVDGSPKCPKCGKLLDGATATDGSMDVTVRDISAGDGSSAMADKTPRTDAMASQHDKVTAPERYSQAMAFARQLERELAEARMDVERYRWLRDGFIGNCVDVHELTLDADEMTSQQFDVAIDVAIDAAIREAKDGKSNGS